MYGVSHVADCLAPCWGPASAGSRGYPQDERRRREKTLETSLDRAKSVRERERVTRRGVQPSLAESGNALFFTIAFIP